MANMALHRTVIALRSIAARELCRYHFYVIINISSSTVRDCETNIKRYRGSAMLQRWLVAILLHCKKWFRWIKGYADIADLIRMIKRQQSNTLPVAA
jgi:hypothetical protein